MIAIVVGICGWCFVLIFTIFQCEMQNSNPYRVSAIAKQKEPEAYAFYIQIALHWMENESDWIRIETNSLRCRAGIKRDGSHSRRLISRTRLRIPNLAEHLRCMDIEAIIYFNVNFERKTVWLAEWHLVFILAKPVSLLLLGCLSIETKWRSLMVNSQ